MDKTNGQLYLHLSHIYICIYINVYLFICNHVHIYNHTFVDIDICPSSSVAWRGGVAPIGPSRSRRITTHLRAREHAVKSTIAHVGFDDGGGTISEIKFVAHDVVAAAAQTAR